MKRATTYISLAAAFGVAMALSACADSRMHISDDFGRAVKQDTMAQIANPDAKYSGDPAPGSNGSRVASAQERYVNGKVVQPVAATIANVGQSGGAGAGASASSGGPQ